MLYASAHTSQFYLEVAVNCHGIVVSVSALSKFFISLNTEIRVNFWVQDKQA